MRIDVADAIINEKDGSRLLQDVLGQHGGDRKSKKVKDQGAIGTLKRGSHSRNYVIARLGRDGHHELAARTQTRGIAGGERASV
jgi:hypothetical protein